MKEIWKDIPELKGRYQASNLGRIRSLSFTKIQKSRTGKKFERTYKGKIIKTDKKVNNAGYETFAAGRDGTIFVHRAVASAFLGTITKRRNVNHKNLNKKDNSLKNLEITTPRQNIRHALRNGRFDEHRLNMSKKSKGIGNPKAKLNEAQVLEIRKQASLGISRKDIAFIFKISVCTVGSIVTRETWKHI